MQALTFHGIDSNNEISLLEYGILLSDQKHEDNSGTQFAVYKIDNDSFGCGHLNESDINNLLNGKEWASKEDINSFLSYVGDNLEDYLQTSFVNKLSDLSSYFGIENIFGTDYCPMTENEVRERYLK